MKSRQPSIDSMALFGMTSIDLVNMISGRKMLRMGEPTGDGERWKLDRQIVEVVPVRLYLHHLVGIDDMESHMPDALSSWFLMTPPSDYGHQFKKKKKKPIQPKSKVSIMDK